MRYAQGPSFICPVLGISADGARRVGAYFLIYPKNLPGVQMRKRLSYANVTATLALFFAISGGAMAANHYLITSTKQVSPKVLKKLTGKAGKAGATGAIGATGAPGATGASGATGKEGPAGAPNPNAINATHATSADFATNATTAAQLTPRGPFVDIPLETGWVNDAGSGGSFKVSPYDVGYYVDREGFVHLRGAADRTSGSSQVIATLPAGARPEGVAGSSFIYFPVYTETETLGTIFIGADGTIKLLSGNAGFVSLDGITFPQGN
jgi:hypothetical protein